MPRQARAEERRRRQRQDPHTTAQDQRPDELTNLGLRLGGIDGHVVIVGTVACEARIGLEPGRLRRDCWCFVSHVVPQPWLYCSAPAGHVR